MTLVIAHRGSHESAPENTLAAFDAAAANGADMIEFDVRRTADDQLAIFHDSEAAKTSLNKLTLTELREASGVPVPTLAEVLEWATHSGVGLDVELKEDGYVAELAPLLAGFGGEMIVTSFIDPVLEQMSALAPEIPRGLLLELTAMGTLKRVAACNATAAVIKMKLLGDGKILDELIDAGYGAYVWGFMPDKHSDWLTHAHVTGFITDDVPGTRTALAD